MKQKLNSLFLPVLTALFPVLFLISANRSELSIVSALPAILILLVSVLLVYFLLGVLFKSFGKSSLITALFALIFLSYGHISDLIPEINPLYLLLILITIALILIIIIVRYKNSLSKLIQFLTLIAVVLVVIQLGGMFLKGTLESQVVINEIYAPIDTANVNENRPDVYYLILDGYGRADVLQETFGYDNSAFVTNLRDIGFFVADSARSNYCQTLFSLAATMNMTYVDSLGQPDIESIDRLWLGEKLRYNRVFDFFRKLDYKLIAFSSGHQYTEFDGVVDHYIDPAKGLTEFNRLLLNTTPIPLFSSDSTSEFGYHRKRVTQSFDILAQLDKYKSPKFVFAHIVSPHPPFVLDKAGHPTQPEGKFRFQDGSHYYIDGGTRQEYITGYVNQLEYVNSRVSEVVINILTQNKNSVIIIQGDHGSRMELDWDSSPDANLRESFSILNAIYLPDQNYTDFYNSLSSVNSFPIILNNQLGLELSLNEEHSFYNSWNQPYLYYDITNGQGSFPTLNEYFESQKNSSIESGNIKVIGYYQASRRKNAGIDSNSPGCHIFDENGLKIKLESVNYSNRIELLLDANDDYVVYFNNGNEMLDTLFVKDMFNESFQHQNRAAIPDKASARGFDNIVIKPLPGDGFYSLGHLLLGKSK